MGFFWVNFWSRDFLGVLLEALRIFLSFDFCPHSIIPITWNPEYPQPWGKGELIHKRPLFDITHIHVWPMRWAPFWGRPVIRAWVYSRKYSNCLKCGNVDIKVLYMILHEATNHHRIEVTQRRSYKYKWKNNYYFSFLKSWSHICKAYQSNALLQYMDILAECGGGGGGRFSDWWVTVPSARQCSSTGSIKAIIIIIICN